MDYLSQETIKFILEHRNDDIRELALRVKHNDIIDIKKAIIQIAGRQIAEKKIPSWAKNDKILYPKHLSMEQCSSEVTARYKATLVKGDTFVDLTGGFGIDCYFIAQKFKHTDYVEQTSELCNIAKHNFNILDRDININNVDCNDYLKKMQPVDCIFIDPARRDKHGAKTVVITDCEPDITKIEEMLVKKAKIVMIKLSPMLDIHSAISELKFINSLHIIAVNNECKELVIILTENSHYLHNDIIINCEQITNTSSSQHFKFTYTEERNANVIYSENVKKYIYEPGAAILKAGAFKLLSSKYGVEKLHPNSHLYTSNEIKEFPGKRFEIIEISTFGKKELKAFTKDLEKANITIRNFPSTVADLRKKLKIKEGGDLHIFATTLYNGEKILIKCKSIKSPLT